MIVETCRKRALLMGCALIAMTMGAAPAEAADADELEARIAALEAMIADLRQEIDAAQAADEIQEARVIRIEQQVESSPAATSAPAAPDSGFMAGNTRVAFGGFIDVDAHVTEFSDGDLAPGSIGRDFYIPGATPIGGESSGVETDMTAEATRFFFTTSTPTDNGPVTSRLEMDFLGSVGGNERVSNSNAPRIRHAWINLGNWRIGQDWSTFQNTAAIPESASFLVASDGMVFVRQPQIRYTRGNWQFALENPLTTTTPNGGGGRITTENTALPDMVVRYNRSGDFGSFSLAGLVRNLAADSGAIDGNTTGWGVSASGRLNLTENGDLRFNLAGGEGMGRYIGLNAINGAVATASGDLEAIPSYGGLVAWRQGLGEGRRINLGYSYLQADNDVALTGSGVTRTVQSGFFNYLVTVAPSVTVGAELLYGQRELENGSDGAISRFTFSTKYAF